MDTAHTIAITILVLALLMAVIGHKSRTVGPLLHLGMGIGLGLGLSSMWLLWQAVG